MQIELENKIEVKVGDVISFTPPNHTFNQENLLVCKLNEKNSVIKLISLNSTLDKGSYFSLEDLQEAIENGGIIVTSGIEKGVEITDFYITSRDNIIMQIK